MREKTRHWTKYWKCEKEISKCGIEENEPLKIINCAGVVRNIFAKGGMKVIFFYSVIDCTETVSIA